MKDELLDKEVLCVYDIRAIQKYIFSKDSNIDVLGAGDFVREIHQDAFAYAMTHSSMPLTADQYCLRELEDPDDIPYFYDENILAQVVTIGGGNAFMLYRTGRIAEAINKCYSRYLVEKSYSLQVAIASVDCTGNFASDVNRLYIDLERVKNTQPFLHPLGTLPIVETEETTGNPVCGTDEISGDRVSTETTFKRVRARRPERAESLSNIANLNQYNTTLAYLHIDGNNVGLTIGKIFNAITDYEEGVRLRRYLNRNFQHHYIASSQKAADQLKAIMVKNGMPEEHFSRYFQIVHIGGDDVNVVCASRYAFTFAQLFINIVKQEYLWNDERVGAIKFSVCGGIAFVPSHVGYVLGIRLAEQCCSEAKAEAKKPVNAVNGAVGNWLDYQIVTGEDLEDIALIREQNYVSNGVSLCLRPYCLDVERAGTPTYFGNLIELCETAFNKKLFNPTVRGRLLATLSENISNVQAQLGHAMLQLSAEGRREFEENVRPRLGNPTVVVEGREKPCACWYDGLELVNFLKLEDVEFI